EWGHYAYNGFDLDRNPSAFSDAEKRMIRQAWQSLAEDFLPFDVDVTTEEPPPGGLSKNGRGDTTWGIRAVVSSNETTSPYGGWAIPGSFDDNADNMLYAGYNPRNTDWVEVGDMIAHEAGHAVGLSHDSTASEEYWTGHGTDGTATYYAPIMGWTWYGPSTWDQGAYNGADNQEDDLEIITNDAVGNPNGFGYRADDHGSNTGSATPITDGVMVEGIIERNTDLDYFSFTMADAGNVTFDINPNSVDPTYAYGTGTPTGTVGANLDILAEIRDASGNVIHTSNPTETLDASFDVNLAAGNYFLSIDGTGKGDPATNGYSDYASLGYYSILGSGWDDPGILGDISGDGALDGIDWSQFIAAHETDLSGLTPAQQFAAGDLNADGFNNYADFQLFFTYYENAHGLGAFETMLASIPEPGSIMLFAAGAAVLGVWRKKQARLFSAAIAAGLILSNLQSADAAIVDLPVSDPNFEDHSVTGNWDYIASVTSDWKSNGNSNFLYSKNFNEENTVVPIEGDQATHGYGSGHQWQATTNIFGVDGSDSSFTFSALISDDGNNSANDDVVLYIYDAGIDGTLSFNPNDVLASAAFNPPTRSWVREEVSFDAATTQGQAVAGNRVGIAMYLRPEFLNGAGADAVLLSGPIAVPPIPPSPLEIIVDRETGMITVDNTHTDAADHEISYYRITSGAGALDPTEGSGWDSLSDQNIDPVGTGPGETWDEAGGSNANLLSEAFLLGSSELSISETQALGNAYAGAELADEDLVFQYSLRGGELESGLVTYTGAYVTALDPGDFNGDSIVNGADFLKWQQDDGTTTGLAEWEANYGNVYALAAATAAVPESSSLLLVTVGLLGMGCHRRRQV
ncbi:MAG: PEP-CTERM sorting domain-containing protein, partial [Bythopirellula sp.]